MQIGNNPVENQAAGSNLKIPLLSEEERKSGDANLLHLSSTGAASSSLDHGVRSSHENVVHVDGHDLKEVTQEHTALQGNIKPTRSWSEYFSSFFFSKTTSNSLAELKSHSITRSTSLTSWICGWRKMALSADLKIIDAINAQRNLSEPAQNDVDLIASRTEPEEKKVEPTEKQSEVSKIEFEAAKTSILQSLVDSKGALQRAQEKAKNGGLDAVETDIQKAKKAANEAQKAFDTIREFVIKHPENGQALLKAREGLEKTTSNLSQAEQLLQEKKNELHQKTVSEAQTAINLATKEVIAIYRSQIQGKSSEQIEENLALIERNNPHSHLHECLQRIYFSLPTESSILSDQEVATIVKEYIDEPTIKTINLTPSEILDETNPFLAGDKILAYKSNVGLHLIPASELKNQSKASLEEVRKKLASAIGEKYGAFLEEKFNGYFFPQGRSVIPLKVENVRNFFKENLLFKPGKLLSSNQDVKKEYEKHLKDEVPKTDHDYSSVEIDNFEKEPVRELQAGFGALKESLPSEMIQKAPMLQQAYAHVSGSESLEELKEDPRFGPVALVGGTAHAGIEYDWPRFELKINGIIIKPAGEELNEERFKSQIEELTKLPCSPQQIEELKILMSRNGRTAGFASGSNLKTGLSLGTQLNTLHSRSESVDITFSENRLKLNYRTGATYLKNIDIPTPLDEREFREQITRANKNAEHFGRPQASEKQISKLFQLIQKDIIEADTYLKSFGEGWDRDAIHSYLPKPFEITLGYTKEGGGLFDQSSEVLDKLSGVIGDYTYSLGLDPSKTFRENFSIDRSQIGYFPQQ